jgi:hypothetical protein
MDTSPDCAFRLAGGATSAANRLLLAAVNVRLGVWLPRPASIVPRHGGIASRVPEQASPV